MLAECTHQLHRAALSTAAQMMHKSPPNLLHAHPHNVRTIALQQRSITVLKHPPGVRGYMPQRETSANTLGGLR
jgi:hypothetical protein